MKLPMHKFINELEKGYYVKDDKICITEWIKTWLEVYIEPNVSPTTLSRYQGMIHRYIDPVIGHIQVQQMTTLAVQSWVNSLRTSPTSGKEVSAATIKHTYHVLKGAMDKAVLTGIIYRSPCTGIMLPKGHKKAGTLRPQGYHHNHEHLQPCSAFLCQGCGRADRSADLCLTTGRYGAVNLAITAPYP